MDTNRVVIPNKIPDGVPGAGWIVSILVIICAIVLVADFEGWSFSSGAHQTAAPTPAHHTTTGAGTHDTK